MTNDQKKEWAQLLYVKEQLTQGEIAEKVGISEQTLSKWKKEERWDTLKKSLLTTRQKELARMYDQLSELNDSIAGREEGTRYASKGEADTLIKLTAAIRNLEIETSLAQVVDVFLKFNDFVRTLDLDEAKKLVDLQDSYIKSLLK